MACRVLSRWRRSPLHRAGFLLGSQRALFCRRMRVGAHRLWPTDLRRPQRPLARSLGADREEERERTIKRDTAGGRTLLLLLDPPPWPIERSAMAESQRCLTRT